VLAGAAVLTREGGTLVNVEAAVLTRKAGLRIGVVLK
jgi:hypothetical protein